MPEIMNWACFAAKANFVSNDESVKTKPVKILLNGKVASLNRILFQVNEDGPRLIVETVEEKPLSEPAKLSRPKLGRGRPRKIKAASQLEA